LPEGPHRRPAVVTGPSTISRSTSGCSTGTGFWSGSRNAPRHASRMLNVACCWARAKARHVIAPRPV